MLIQEEIGNCLKCCCSTNIDLADCYREMCRNKQDVEFIWLGKEIKSTDSPAKFILRTKNCLRMDPSLHECTIISLFARHLCNFMGLLLFIAIAARHNLQYGIVGAEGRTLRRSAMDPIQSRR